MSEPAVERRDRWIPWAFVGFFCGLAALEGGFVMLARESFSGLVTDHAYATGLAYNDILATRTAENALGWSIKVKLEPGAPEAMGGRLRLTLADRAGRPLTGVAVKATAERMSRFPQILSVDFRPDGPGEQVSAFAPPLAGRWFIRVRVERDGQVAHAIQDVEVTP